jgi:hypothetical protein
VAGGDQPGVHGERLLTSGALELLVLQETQQLELDAAPDLGHLVEEQRAAVGLQAPALSRRRSGSREGARLAAEELRFELRLVQARTVEPDQGPIATLTELVEGGSDQTLAGPGLAVDQHRHLRRGDPLDQLSHPLHGGVVAEKAREAVPALLLRPQSAHLGHVAGLDDGSVHHVEQHVEVGLGSELHRTHGIGHAGEAGHHDHGGLGSTLADLLKEADSVHPGHAHVRDDHVGRKLGEDAERLEGRPHHLGVESLGSHQRAQSCPCAGLVLDHDDPTPALLLHRPRTHEPLLKQLDGGNVRARIVRRWRPHAHPWTSSTVVSGGRAKINIEFVVLSGRAPSADDDAGGSGRERPARVLPEPLGRLGQRGGGARLPARGLEEAPRVFRAGVFGRPCPRRVWCWRCREPAVGPRMER